MWTENHLSCEATLSCTPVVHKAMYERKTTCLVKPHLVVHQLFIKPCMEDRLSCEATLSYTPVVHKAMYERKTTCEATFVHQLFKKLCMEGRHYLSCEATLSCTPVVHKTMYGRKTTGLVRTYLCTSRS